MRDEHDLSALEAKLSTWQPAAPRLDRDQLLYEAGAAAGRRSARRQFGAAFGVLLALGGLAASLAVRGRDRSITRLVATNETLRGELERRDERPVRTPIASEVRPPEPSSYLVLTRGGLAPTADVGSAGPDGAATDRAPLTPLSARVPGSIEL